MKNLTLILLGAIAQTSLIHADKPAPVPTGSINVNLAMVRQGVAPSLNWKIEYPKVVTDVVDIPPTDEIIPKTKLRVKISMIGVGLTNGYGTQFPAKNKIKFGYSNWENFFTGRGRDVRPNNILVDRIVQAGERIRYSAKVDAVSHTQTFATHYNDSANVTVLKNGDNPPSVAAGYDHQTPVASYLRPYVKDGKIAIGPMDLIYVSELTHTNPAVSGFDMQDSIVLLQFEKITDE